MSEEPEGVLQCSCGGTWFRQEVAAQLATGLSDPRDMPAAHLKSEFRYFCESCGAQLDRTPK